MLKKILVVLDTSKSSQRVQDMAINMALNTSAKITGIGILDTPSITHPYIEPLAGIAYNIDHEKEIIDQSHNKVLELFNIFKKRGEENNLEIDTIEVEGDPIEQINILSQEHNIIIMSRKTNFHFEGEDETDITVKKIARDNTRPVIIIPPHEKLGEDILIAYDGSKESTRSLHMFLLLGFWEGHTIHIISINEDDTDANEVSMQAYNMCSLYNIEPKIHIKTSTRKNVPYTIMNLAKELKVWMLVIGSFKHNQLHDVLFESCTSTLMKNCSVPLFIHH